MGSRNVWNPAPNVLLFIPDTEFAARQGLCEKTPGKLGRRIVHNQLRSRQLSARAGLTLMEVVVALAISGLAVAAIVTGYLFSIASAQPEELMAAGWKASRVSWKRGALPTSLRIMDRW